MARNSRLISLDITRYDMLTLCECFKIPLLRFDSETGLKPQKIRSILLFQTVSDKFWTITMFKCKPAEYNSVNVHGHAC
jgi:hypothetical protein